MTTTAVNKTLIPILSIGILVCLALLPWKRWCGPDPETRLGVRIAEYAKLRKQEDWIAIYSLMDARDRKAVPLPTFLTLYGRGTLKTIELTEKVRQVDRPNATALVTMTLDAELQLDKLPASYRKSLGPQDPANLRKTADFATEWSWSDGEWWLRMDKEATTGKSSEGRDVTPAGG